MNRILITIGSSLSTTSLSSVLSTATSYACKETQQQQLLGVSSPEPSLDNNLLVWEFLFFLRSLFYYKLLHHQYHANNTIYYIHVPFKHNCRTVLITWYKQTNNRWGQWCGMSLHFKQPNNMYICRIFVVVIRCSTPITVPIVTNLVSNHAFSRFISLVAAFAPSSFWSYQPGCQRQYYCSLLSCDRIQWK